MIDEEKFEESKARCPMLTIEYEDLVCRITKSYCEHIDDCPIVFWINKNEERR